MNRHSRRAAASQARREQSPAGVCAPDTGPVALYHPKSGDILRASLLGHSRACASCGKDREVFVLGDHPTRGVFSLCAECARKEETILLLDKWTVAADEQGEFDRRADLVQTLREWAAE